MRRFGWIAVATVAIVGLAGGFLAWSAEPAEPAPEGFAIQGDAEQGKILYAVHCKKCHGKTGTGNGIMAADLDPKPNDLTDAEAMGKISDWELFVAVRDGSRAVGLSDQMPAAGDVLSDEEIHDVLAYAKTFSAEEEW